jgi:hypothetical protein
MERYRVIETLRFVKERKFENNFEDFVEVNHQLVTRGWQVFNNVLGDGNATLVREFYAHAHRTKTSIPYRFDCVVRGVRIDYSMDAWNRFLELQDVEHCVVQARGPKWDASNVKEQDEMKDRRCLPGTEWLCGQTTTRRVKLNRLNPEARVWAEFFVSNVEPSGNSSEVTINKLTLIDAVCTGEAVNSGLLLRDSIQRLADKKEKRATLGHCSLLTSLLCALGVPTVPEDEVVKPKGPVNMKWLEKTLRTEAPLEEQGNFDDIEAEIDGFEGVDLNLGMDPPNMGQPDMGAFPGPTLTPEVAPNQHSVNELAALLTQMDIVTALRLSNNYYDQTSALYREAMTTGSSSTSGPSIPFIPPWRTCSASGLPKRLICRLLS